MLTQEYLKCRLHYDPITGLFTWLVTNTNSKKPGTVAGCPDPNYIRITIDNILYSAHRLAWLYMTGEWPKEEVDHKDLNGLNNKWENLREATRQQNNQNRSSLHPLPKGVTLYHPNLKNPYKAVIRIGGKNRHLGFFRTPEAAHEVYRDAAQKAFGEFARIK